MSVRFLSYTKGNLDEIKKARERVDRMANAINTALNANSVDNYKKLQEATQKSSGGKGSSDEE